MKVTDGQAESGIGLKSAIGCHHYYTWRLEGIVFGEYELSVIIATYRSGPGSEQY